MESHCYWINLFLNRNDVCVVEMTYNSTTNVTLYYFWLRFIHAVIPYDLSLHELIDRVGSFDEPKNIIYYGRIKRCIFSLHPLIMLMALQNHY